MIKIKISEDQITATGHAGAGPRGRDLVCAGVSVLLMTLAEYLAEVGAEGLSITLDSGIGEVSARNHPAAFAQTAAGLRLLEECYPECVRCHSEERPKGLASRRSDEESPARDPSQRRGW